MYDVQANLFIVIIFDALWFSNLQPLELSQLGIVVYKETKNILWLVDCVRWLTNQLLLSWHFLVWIQCVFSTINR